MAAATIAGHYSPFLVTRWYRPPEMLLGSRQYTMSVDLWSAGCMLAELLTGSVLFPGKDDFDQLERIFDMCGTPTAETWPSVEELPSWGEW